MKIKIYLRVLLSFGILIAALPLAAHPLSVESGVGSGLLHPFTGIDHVIAMLAVGIWVVQRGSQYLWKIPLFFSLVLLAGVMLASTGIQLPMAETVIALSILFLGIVISLQPRVRTFVGMLMITGFAIYHGYAHGIAVPAGAITTEYLTGLWFSTALLLSIGIIVALFLQIVSNRVLRWSGAPLIGIGSLLLLSV